MHECKYWIDEKFFIKGSKKQIPFCSCECSTNYYTKHNYLNKEVLKNVR
jgi:hypothetical protein